MEGCKKNSKPRITFEKNSNDLKLTVKPSKTLENRFFHETLIGSIRNCPLTEKELLAKFPDYSYILPQVLQREIGTGKIRAYKRKGKRYFRATILGTKIIDLSRKSKFISLGR